MTAPAVTAYQCQTAGLPSLAETAPAAAVVLAGSWQGFHFGDLVGDRRVSSLGLIQYFREIRSDGYRLLSRAFTALDIASG